MQGDKKMKRERERKSRGKTLRTHTHRGRDDAEISTQAHRKMRNIEHIHRQTHLHTFYESQRQRNKTFS